MWLFFYECDKIWCYFNFESFDFLANSWFLLYKSTNLFFSHLILLWIHAIRKYAKNKTTINISWFTVTPAHWIKRLTNCVNLFLHVSRTCVLLGLILYILFPGRCCILPCVLLCLASISPAQGKWDSCISAIYLCAFSLFMCHKHC